MTKSDSATNGETPVFTHRGANALRITGERDESEQKDEETGEPTLTLTEVAWLFVFGTTPFFVFANLLLWYEPSAIIATMIFWITGGPLAVVFPLAVIGSIYTRIGGNYR